MRSNVHPRRSPGRRVAPRALVAVLALSLAASAIDRPAATPGPIDDPRTAAGTGRVKRPALCVGWIIVGSCVMGLGGALGGPTGAAAGMVLTLPPILDACS